MSTLRIDDDSINNDNPINPQSTIRLDDSSQTIRTNESSQTTIRIPEASNANETGTLRVIEEKDTQVKHGQDLLNGNVRQGNIFLLNGKEYTQVRLIAKSGEADIYEITNNGQSLVLKYYYSNFRPKEEILERLSALKRKDVITPLDYGYVQDRFYEIIEFMQGGTLQDLFPLRDMEKISSLVAQVITALNACHEVRIIHRDIKPENIFFRDKARKELVIADFGISSVHYEGVDLRKTTKFRSPIYAAPEQSSIDSENKMLIDKKVDYYALGISLLELWLGRNPFEGVDDSFIPRIKQDGRVVIPKEMQPDLVKLIKGLITTETHKRWGYDEVQKWLRGEPVNVYFKTMDLRFEDYVFDMDKGIVINDPKDLAYHMEQDPEKAAMHLHSNIIKNWLDKTSKDLAAEISIIYEREYLGNTPEGTKAAVTKAIYVLDKYKPYKSFDGSTWKDMSKLSEHIEANHSHYRKELAKPTATLYLFLEARGAKDRAERYRKYYRDYPDKLFSLSCLIYMIIHLNSMVKLIPTRRSCPTPLRIPVRNYLRR
jgi:serine/threonine protein kinase